MNVLSARGEVRGVSVYDPDGLLAIGDIRKRDRCRLIDYVIINVVVDVEKRRQNLAPAALFKIA